MTKEREMHMRGIQVDLTGLRALVTGGSRGIGEAVARALAASGAAVVVNYKRSEAAAQAIVRDLQARGNRAVAIRADVSDPAQAENLVRQAEQALGATIDILVNNAGSPVGQASIEEMPVELWNAGLALNLTSAMVCARAVIPGMKARGWGRIVNVSSISARSGGGPGGSHYAAAKAGIDSLTRSLAKELGAHGITVNGVAPGVILTEIHEKFNTPETLEQLRQATLLKHLGHVDDIAGAVLFLVSDAAAYVTGETIAINGGLRLD